MTINALSTLAPWGGAVLIPVMRGRGKMKRGGEWKDDSYA